MSQLEIALQYAKAGVQIFPCYLANKQPMTGNSFKDATCDEQIITDWWTKVPDALIGAPNGDFVVMDFDIYNLNDVQMLIMQPAIDELEEKLIADNQLTVTTLSGGLHYYYRADNDVPRKIKSIAEVDILGSGGYSILPDQKNYVANHKAPWELFNNKSEGMNKFDLPTFEEIAGKYRENTKTIKTLLSASKGSSSRTNVKRGKPTERRFNSDTTKYSEVEADIRENGVENYSLGIVNYESETVEFRIERDLYKVSGKEYDKEDPNIDYFEEGAIKPKEGELNNEVMMRLFYNNKTQERLADYLGISVPRHKTDTVSMHSIFPSHVDEHKSMGVRWNNTGTHLLVRDFANHYTDIHCQTDYNLVRLYCVLQYKTNVPRLNGPEFTVWMMRLMVDAGLIDVEHLKVETKPTDKLHATQKEMLNSFQLLDAIKRSYEGYDGTSTFADKFSSAWSRLSPSTANRTKKALAAKGLIEIVGNYDCSGGKRDDNFFMTKLYKMPVKEPVQETPIGETKMKISEAFNSVMVSRADKQKKQVEKIYPNMSTLVTLIVDEGNQRSINNFAEDFKIGEVPEYDNMFIPLFISEKFEIIEVNEGSTYYMDQFVLEVIDRSDGQGKLLVVTGTSPSISKLIDRVGDQAPSLIEDNTPNFVISNNFDDTDVDLDYLTLRFNEYVDGKISLSEIDLRYMDQESLVEVLDGKSLSNK